MRVPIPYQPLSTLSCPLTAHLGLQMNASGKDSDRLDQLVLEHEAASQVLA